MENNGIINTTDKDFGEYIERRIKLSDIADIEKTIFDEWEQLKGLGYRVIKTSVMEDIGDFANIIYIHYKK